MLPGIDGKEKSPGDGGGPANSEDKGICEHRRVVDIVCLVRPESPAGAGQLDACRQVLLAELSCRSRTMRSSPVSRSSHLNEHLVADR